MPKFGIVSVTISTLTVVAMVMILVSPIAFFLFGLLLCSFLDKWAERYKKLRQKKLVKKCQEETGGKASYAEKASPPRATSSRLDVTTYEVNGAKQILGKTFDSIKEIINRAEISHEGIVRSFREAGWSTETPLLGGYRCDAYKDGVVVEIESVDKSSVIDVLHRDLFRFLMLHRKGVLKVAVLITRTSGGEVSLKKVMRDMEIYGKHYETPLLVIGV